MARPTLKEAIEVHLKSMREDKGLIWTMDMLVSASKWDNRALQLAAKKRIRELKTDKKVTINSQ